MKYFYVRQNFSLLHFTLSHTCSISIFRQSRSFKKFSRNQTISFCFHEKIEKFGFISGRNEKLGLTGRMNRNVGVLSTSKLYKIQDKIFAFTPQRFDLSKNYMDSDISLMITTLENGLTYLSKCWTASGRPTVSLVLGPNILENGKIPRGVISALKKLKVQYFDLKIWPKSKFCKNLFNRLVT